MMLIIRLLSISTGSLLPESDIAVCVQAAQVACAASGATGQDGAACSSWITLRRTAPIVAAPAMKPAVPALEPAAAATPAAEPFAAPAALIAPAPEPAGERDGDHRYSSQQKADRVLGCDDCCT